MQKTIYTFLFILIASFSYSQTQEQLEQRKAKLQEEIRANEMKLQDVRKQEKSVGKLLEIQKEKIGLKEKLIGTTVKQAKLLNDGIYKNQIQINSLKKELKTLKEDYAAMIVKSYKSRSEQSRLMFLLSSESFQQAYKRLQYMKQYTNYRKSQGLEIQDKGQQLLDFNAKLSGQKTEKEQILADQEKQKKDLIKEKADQEVIANSLKKSKNQIAGEIKKDKRESNRIDAQIKKIIRDAIAEANRKAAAERAKNNPTTTSASDKREIENSTSIVLTPEGKIISDNFKANKGRLPWPVEKGAITLPFGNSSHPVYRIEIHNSGIEITTENGANARAVFGGEVYKVLAISPVNKMVMIRHGDYFSMYQNLSSVNVSAGDKVSIKQTIGKIRTNPDGNTVLKFMISQNTDFTNPSSWLNK
jgi:septal ring factor EnvC (AmiA/AmiB activator)